ncbi:hypothetical protein QT621_24950, partial [Xanthomonas citri pv. citri]
TAIKRLVYHNQHIDGVEVISVDSRDNTALPAQSQILSADAYVLALGSYSPALVKELGINLPIYPAKGYSATYPV